MFFKATFFNRPVDGWDVSNVKTMENMFESALAFDQSLLAWNLLDGVKLTNIFTLSGMRNSYLCDLKTKGGAWIMQWSALGKEASCA